MFKIARIMLAIALVTMGISSMASAQLPGGWKSYHNPVGSFTTCYPTSLRPQPVSTSSTGSGRMFEAGPVSVLVYNTKNLLEVSLNEQADNSMMPSEIKSDRVARGNQVVIVGKDGRNTFWRKIIQRGDDFVMINVIFPTSQLAQGREMVKTIAACTRA